MENFQLQPFFSIDGIGAASGLVYAGHSLFIISDNSTFLYRYDFEPKALAKIKLLENSAENLAKKDKPDFEAMTLFNNSLYLFGSGSTKKRDVRLRYDLETLEIEEKDLSKIHKRLRESIGLADDELNTEGIIITENQYYFFQRGNGQSAQNGIFSYDRKEKSIVFYPVALPTVHQVEATFTDAVLIDTTVFFLAACEDTTSTYTDGAIYGSFIGGLDLQTKTLLFTHQISETNKFEGLTLYQKTENSLEFLLCEDNDTEELHTTIYKLTLRKPQ